MQKFFYTLFFIYFCHSVTAQDTLVLISGRKIVVSSVDLKDNTIAYRNIKSGSKLKTIDPGRVFSVIYRDGKERIIFETDSLDPIDFKVEEMRNFIKGEQDALKFYNNTLIKIAGVGIGGGFGLLGFYGLVGPPLYSTIIGSYSPNVEKKLSFNVSGDAAEAIGINSGKYMNDITGKNTSPEIKKNQSLKISGKTILFTKDANLDSTVSLINSHFKCTRVNAANVNGKIKLYKSNTPDLITVGAYREGFEKKVRDYKIRNGMLSGIIGFIIGSITYAIVY